MVEYVHEKTRRQCFPALPHHFSVQHAPIRHGVATNVLDFARIQLKARKISIPGIFTIRETNLCLDDGTRARGMKNCDEGYGTFCCVGHPCCKDALCLADDGTCFPEEPGIFDLPEKASPFTTMNARPGRISTPTITPTADTSVQSTPSATLSDSLITPPGNPAAAQSPKHTPTIPIAVGVSVGVVALLVASLLLLWWRRRLARTRKAEIDGRQEPTPSHNPYQIRTDHRMDHSNLGYASGELCDSHSLSQAVKLVEVPSSPWRSHELPTGYPIVPELPGHWGQRF